MSDATKDFQENLAREAERERKRKEVLEKELQLRDRKANNELANFDRADKNILITKNIDLRRLSAMELNRYTENNNNYFESAKNPIQFIGPMFDDYVPFWRNNLILVGAETGQGKSTCISNIVIAALRQGKKLLVLTNEQSANDFYNMITCMLRGWSYTDHHNFTKEQIKILSDQIKFLGESGRLTVIDDNYGGSSGVTSTIEGIESIFDNLIANKTDYDAVLLDYYQNVWQSALNPRLNEYEVQRMLTNKLNAYKDSYPAPIVLMAQIKPQLEGETIPFKIRLEGTKAIINKCTQAMEMVAKKKELKTEWIIIKSRFAPKTQGETVTTGFDKGRFVQHDTAFQKQVVAMQDRKMMAHTMKGLEKNAKVPEETNPSGSPANDGGKPGANLKLVPGVDQGDQTPP